MKQLFFAKKIDKYTSLLFLQQKDIRVHYDDVFLGKEFHSFFVSTFFLCDGVFIVLVAKYVQLDNAMYYFLIRCTISATTIILNLFFLFLQKQIMKQNKIKKNFNDERNRKRITRNVISFFLHILLGVSCPRNEFSWIFFLSRKMIITF